MKETLTHLAPLPVRKKYNDHWFLRVWRQCKLHRNVLFLPSYLVSQEETVPSIWHYKIRISVIAKCHESCSAAIYKALNVGKHDPERIITPNGKAKVISLNQKGGAALCTLKNIITGSNQRWKTNIYWYHLSSTWVVNS